MHTEAKVEYRAEQPYVGISTMATMEELETAKPQPYGRCFPAGGSSSRTLSCSSFHTLVSLLAPPRPSPPRSNRLSSLPIRDAYNIY